MRALVLLAFSLWLCGCSHAGASARAPSKESEPLHLGQGVVGPAAGSYTTRPTPGAVRGGPDADRIEQALMEVARQRGMDLTGDGRLAELATFIAAAMDPSGSPPASSAVDAYSRHLGLIEPVPLFMVFGQVQEAGVPQTLEQMLRG